MPVSIYKSKGGKKTKQTKKKGRVVGGDTESQSGGGSERQGGGRELEVEGSHSTQTTFESNIPNL